MNSFKDDVTPALNGDEAGKGAQLLKDLAAMLAVAAEALDSVRPDMAEGVNFYDEVRRFETALIERALRQAGGNQSQAARLLQLKQTTLHGKIRQYNICLSGQVYSHQPQGRFPSQEVRA